MVMKWIPIEKELPEDGEMVLVTVWHDDGYGGRPYICYDVDLAYFYKDDPYSYIPVEGGGFNTINDWIEGQPVKILAWAHVEPYKPCNMQS